MFYLLALRLLGRQPPASSYECAGTQATVAERTWNSPGIRRLLGEAVDFLVGGMSCGLSLSRA